MKMPHFFRAIYVVLFQTQQLRKSPGKINPNTNNRE